MMSTLATLLLSVTFGQTLSQAILSETVSPIMLAGNTIYECRTLQARSKSKHWGLQSKRSHLYHFDNFEFGDLRGSTDNLPVLIRILGQLNKIGYW